MAVRQLDQPSRAAVGRFCLKVCVSLLLASRTGDGYLIATSVWITLYALFTGGIALLRRERFEARSFNHWDEALWLVAVGQALYVAHMAAA